MSDISIEDLPDRWRRQAELAESDGEILAAEVYKGASAELEARLESETND